jgi:hypothetical protein
VNYVGRFIGAGRRLWISPQRRGAPRPHGVSGQRSDQNGPIKIERYELRWGIMLPLCMPFDRHVKNEFILVTARAAIGTERSLSYLPEICRGDLALLYCSLRMRDIWTVDSGKP